MTASPRSPSGRRAQLGSPVLPVNASGTYLRHRAAAEQAHLARRRALWWYRVICALVLCIFYFAIGRDLLALARAKRDTAAMTIRQDARQLTKDLKQMAGAARAASDQTVSPPAPDKVTPEQLEALVDERGVGLWSGAAER